VTFWNRENIKSNNDVTEWKIMWHRVTPSTLAPQFRIRAWVSLPQRSDGQLSSHLSAVLQGLSSWMQGRSHGPLHLREERLIIPFVVVAHFTPESGGPVECLSRRPKGDSSQINWNKKYKVKRKVIHSNKTYYQTQKAEPAEWVGVLKDLKNLEPQEWPDSDVICNPS